MTDQQRLMDEIVNDTNAINKFIKWQNKQPRPLRLQQIAVQLAEYFEPQIELLERMGVTDDKVEELLSSYETGPSGVLAVGVSKEKQT